MRHFEDLLVTGETFEQCTELDSISRAIGRVLVCFVDLRDQAKRFGR